MRFLNPWKTDPEMIKNGKPVNVPGNDEGVFSMATTRDDIIILKPESL